MPPKPRKPSIMDHFNKFNKDHPVQWTATDERRAITKLLIEQELYYRRGAAEADHIANLAEDYTLKVNARDSARRDKHAATVLNHLIAKIQRRRKK